MLCQHSRQTHLLEISISHLYLPKGGVCVCVGGVLKNYWHKGAQVCELPLFSCCFVKDENIGSPFDLFRKHFIYYRLSWSQSREFSSWGCLSLCVEGFLFFSSLKKVEPARLSHQLHFLLRWKTNGSIHQCHTHPSPSHCNGCAHKHAATQILMLFHIWVHWCGPNSLSLVGPLPP